MVAPSDETEKVNTITAKKMTYWLVDNGVHDLFVCGIDGEFRLLSDDEKVELVGTVVEEISNKVTIRVGAGYCSAKQTIESAKWLVDVGTDCISVVMPYYPISNQEDLYHHYYDITFSATTPIILYNLPGWIELSTEHEMVSRLTDIKNIAATKDSSGKFEVQRQYLEIAKHKDFKVLGDSDSLALNVLKEGSVTAVVVTPNVLPMIEVDLYNYFMAGEMEKAQEERNKMDAPRMTIKKMTTPAIMKEASGLMGAKAGITHRPIHMPSDVVAENIKEVLKGYNFL